MLRPFISYVFIFSLLFMGIESAIDSTGGEHPHGDDYAHVLDSDAPLPLDADADADADDNNDHCSHCCHGHTGSIAGNITVLNCDITHQQLAFYRPHFLNFSQAPPTPPPIV